MTDQVRAYRLQDFCKAYSVGLTMAYDLIKKGELRARKIGKKTVILYEDAEAWAKNLPTMGNA